MAGSPPLLTFQLNGHADLSQTYHLMPERGIAGAIGIITERGEKKTHSKNSIACLVLLLSAEKLIHIMVSFICKRE